MLDVDGFGVTGEGDLEERVEGADDSEMLEPLVSESEPPLIQSANLRLTNTSNGKSSTPERP